LGRGLDWGFAKMTRLLISVEGKSEWKFVEQVLQPHFANLEVYIKRPLHK
jgi:hypothetical protein